MFLAWFYMPMLTAMEGDERYCDNVCMCSSAGSADQLCFAGAVKKSGTAATCFCMGRIYECQSHRCVYAVFYRCFFISSGLQRNFVISGTDAGNNGVFVYNAVRSDAVWGKIEL